MQPFQEDPFQRFEEDDDPWTCSSFQKDDWGTPMKAQSHDVEAFESALPASTCSDQTATQQHKQDMSFGSFDSIDFMSPKVRSNASRSIPKNAISPTSVLSTSFGEPTTPFQVVKQPVFITDDGFPAPADTVVVASPTHGDEVARGVTRKNSKKSEKPPKPSKSSSSRRHSRRHESESSSRRSMRSNDGSYSSLDFDNDASSTKRSQRSHDSSFASLDFESDKPSSRRSQRTHDSSMRSLDFEPDQPSSRRSHRSHDGSLASLDGFLEAPSSSRRSHRSQNDSFGSFDTKEDKKAPQRSHSSSSDNKKRSSRTSRSCSHDGKEEKSSSRSRRSVDKSVDNIMGYQNLCDEDHDGTADVPKLRRSSSKSSTSSKASKRRDSRKSDNGSQNGFDLENFLEGGHVDEDQHSAVLTSAAAADEGGDLKKEVSHRSTRSSQSSKPSRRDRLEREPSLRNFLDSNKKDNTLNLFFENVSTDGSCSSRSKIGLKQDAFIGESKSTESDLSPSESNVSTSVSDVGTQFAVFGDAQQRSKPPLAPTAKGGRLPLTSRSSKTLLTPKIDRSRSFEGVIELSPEAKASLRRVRPMQDDIDTSLSSRCMANDWDWEQDRTVCGESVVDGGGFGVPVVHQNSPRRMMKCEKPQRTHSDPFAVTRLRHNTAFGSRNSMTGNTSSAEKVMLPKRKSDGMYRSTTKLAVRQMKEKSTQRKNAVRDSLFSALDQLDEEPEDFFAISK